jgi:hypothetical protein
MTFVDKSTDEPGIDIDQYYQDTIKSFKRLERSSNMWRKKIGEKFYLKETNQITIEDLPLKSYHNLIETDVAE